MCTQFNVKELLATRKIVPVRGILEFNSVFISEYAKNSQKS